MEAASIIACGGQIAGGSGNEEQAEREIVDVGSQKIEDEVEAESGT